MDIVIVSMSLSLQPRLADLMEHCSAPVVCHDKCLQALEPISFAWVCLMNSKRRFSMLCVLVMAYSVAGCVRI